MTYMQRGRYPITDLYTLATIKRCKQVFVDLNIKFKAEPVEWKNLKAKSTLGSTEFRGSRCQICINLFVNRTAKDIENTIL